MLIDKGYYDYDYSEPKRKKERRISQASSAAKLARKLGRLGVGSHPQSLIPEEAQRIVMDEIKAGRHHE